MSDEIRKRYSIPTNHTLEETSTELKGARKGREVEESMYHQLDENGKIVATYTEIHSTSTYPPFNTTIKVLKN